MSKNGRAKFTCPSCQYTSNSSERMEQHKKGYGHAMARSTKQWKGDRVVKTKK